MTHAVDCVHYYNVLLALAGLSARDIRGPEELHKLPTLSKDVVRREGAGLTARDARRYAPRTVRTSGTGGAPLSVRTDRPSRTLEFVYYWRYWGWAGYRVGDPFAELSSAAFMR